MNELQFKIVKFMQKLGVSANTFAKAAGADTVTMSMAFGSNNYEQYRKISSDLDGVSDLFQGIV